jgi:hypothetical protein
MEKKEYYTWDIVQVVITNMMGLGIIIGYYCTLNTSKLG